ncbi:hypothetical protein ABNQ38_31225 [Azospirillum sp. A29]|jgi:DNA-binding NarL/FixJ family response regulator|uniref:hypothetical protein n=1 Tax=Azospirillum sp. A29 TaxID=3160606 RepID=UPI003672A93A
MIDLTGMTVLIAEPYASVASGLCLIIEQWGGTCRVVCSSSKLHASLQSLTPDLMLINIDLAGGREEVEVLSRSYPTMIVAMAARFRTAAEDNCDTVTCLEMPFTMGDLQLAVRSVLP